jgi:hypothetical protein
MAISVEFGPFTPSALSAVKDLLLPHWQRQWSDDLADRIFRWRFVDRPNDEAILAWDHDKCIAMVDSWVRRYVINGTVTPVRELGDWYSRPEYRGVGLQPVWMMMRKPEPMVGAGGTAMTRTLLPRMNWKAMPQRVGDFWLRLSSGVLFERPLRRLPVAGALLASLAHRFSVTIRKVRRHAPPPGEIDVRPLKPTDFDADVGPIPSTYALARLVDPCELKWLHSAPAEMGEFSALLFSRETKPVGVSVSRLFSMGDYQGAYIMHIQASEASTALYAWMVGETATFLAERGAKTIRCRTSAPELKDALRRTAFFEHSSVEPRWWSRTIEPPQGNVSLSLLRADDGLHPYPP